MLHFIEFTDNCIFYKLKVCSNTASDKSLHVFFPIAFAYFVSLYHILVIFTKLEVEFEDVTELLQSHDKNFITLKEFQRK